jgi:sec-independent protein translocase protein TatA
VVLTSLVSHDFVVVAESGDKRGRGPLRKREPVAGHADTAVQSHRDRQRELSSRKGADYPFSAILRHMEIGGFEARHRLAALVGDSRLPFDEVDSGRELRAGSAGTISGTMRGLRSATMGRVGLPELLIILAIIVIIFGANRLPGLGRGIGSAIKNFKEGMKDEQ